MQNNLLILNSAKLNPGIDPNAWHNFNDLVNILTCEYGNSLKHAIDSKQVQIWQFSGKFAATRAI